MSDTITVDIHTPSNEVLANSHIPDYYSVQEVINELVDELQLPRFDPNRTPIEYALYSLSASSYLSSTATIASALRNGDAVRLEAKSNGKKVEVPPTPGATVPPTSGENLNEISVTLSVVDQNRTDQIMLSTKRPVAELISQIVSSYGLPPLDKLGNEIKYSLRSKALGGILQDAMTLGQLNVPAQDRLILTREWTAGASA